MKLSTLLCIQEQLLQHARLANLACAYATLRRLALRAQTTRLHGLVVLRQPDATCGRNWAELLAIDGSQAQIEEIYTDEELMDFADAVAFARGISGLEIHFRIEELDSEFVRPLEGALRRAGVAIDLPATAFADPEPDLAGLSDDDVDQSLR
jgi:predicted Ser/Thr protein kinase